MAPAGPQQPKDAADLLRNMHLRQARKRDAALKRAAVANALLRAEAARAALAAERGAKGAGGKGGKGGDEDDREETCAICQCEFTVGGDSGTYLALLVSGSLGPSPLVEISMKSPSNPL